MSEMIERVARALCCIHWNGPDAQSVGCDCVAWRDHVEDARVVIAAMREPDRDVMKAMCKAMSPEHRPTPERVSSGEKHKIRWRAAIDRILAEPSPKHQSPSLTPGP
jgi:hypothetical protein